MSDRLALIATLAWQARLSDEVELVRSGGDFEIRTDEDYILRAKSFVELTEKLTLPEEVIRKCKTFYRGQPLMVCRLADGHSGDHLSPDGSLQWP